MPNKSLTTFSHQTNSTMFNYADLGDMGAKFEMGDPDDQDETRAIILPPDKVFELARMILGGTGQDIQKIPPKVLSMFERIDEEPRRAFRLELGEKAACKKTLALWRISQGRIRKTRNRQKSKGELK